MLKIFFLLIGCSGIAGCATQYRDPALVSAPMIAPSTLEAEPRGSFLSGRPNVAVQAIDGVSMPAGRIEKYELTPGIHSIQFRLVYHFHEAPLLTRNFRAESGEVYMPKLWIDVVKKQWGVNIINKNTGQSVGIDP